jgi:hypothetical protein
MMTLMVMMIILMLMMNNIGSMHNQMYVYKDICNYMCMYLFILKCIQIHEYCEY